MSQIVVVYHSGYGHTQRVAQQVAEGANAQLLAIDADGNLPEGGWETLNAADAIIFGTPHLHGGPSWQFKKFADASSKAWFSPYLARQGVWWLYQQRQFQRRQAGHADCAANPGVATLVACGSAWACCPATAKAATRSDVNNLGGSVGLLVQSPSDASVAEIPEGDLDTAKLYGKRVADITARLKG